MDEFSRGNPLVTSSQSASPAIIIVDDDAATVAEFEDALNRRFGADYRILTAHSSEEGLDLLTSLAAERAEIALIAAGLKMSRIQGVEFLCRAHAMHRNAYRALIVGMDETGIRLPGDTFGEIQCAIAVGQADITILKGWVSPEEWFYPQVQETLTAWTRAHRPRHEVVRIVGEQWSARSYRLWDLLNRNTVPTGFCDASSPEGQQLLAELGLDGSKLPVAVMYSGEVLVDPTNYEIAKALGVKTKPDPGSYDLMVVGAGPAGLAAAVYGASEGLRTVVFEPEALGGQAATSSMIRNYLGFPRGLSGGELTSRAYEQARLLGAQFIFSQSATGLSADGHDRVLSLSDGTSVVGRAVMIATGVTYRRLDNPSIDAYLGAGVFYGAAATEARAMTGLNVFVLGAGNSAGQAALHLAKYAAHVTIIARGKTLATTMSDYLIREIESVENVSVRLQTTVAGGWGEYRLSHLELTDQRSGSCDTVPADALFVLIGAAPHTDWLEHALARDDEGYILTGNDVPAAAWRLSRRPLPHECSMPGVFAVGDVRAGSVKRVASAVGEGSVAVRFVHEYLAGVSITGVPAER